MDISTLLSQIQQNPAVLEMVASQLAQNPQMVPPAPGSMAEAMKSASGAMPDVTQGAAQPTPAVPQAPAAGPAPLAAGVSLAQALAGSQNPMTPEQLIAAQNPAANVTNPFAALQPPEAQKPMPPAYIGNLAFGAATPAQGLKLPYSPAAAPGSLASYLRG